MGYARCPFDPARLAAAISTEVTKLSLDEANKFLGPEPALLKDPIIADLTKAAGLSKP
jgi:hypothetical protein